MSPILKAKTEEDQQVQRAEFVSLRLLNLSRKDIIERDATGEFVYDPENKWWYHTKTLHIHSDQDGIAPGGRIG